MSTTWTAQEVLSKASAWSGAAWRVVEAQHVASTMKLVDSQAEQDLLEALLEGSKPPLPDETAGLHYLLATPYRYPTKHPSGSRFRSAADPGVFYAAGNLQTACAELGYHRWRFLSDAIDLTVLDPVPHTAFSVNFKALAVDLTKEPFTKDSSSWRHPTDYLATQGFARVARQAGVEGIKYQSVRDPDPNWCVALLHPRAFSHPHAPTRMETWWLAVRKNEVRWEREREQFVFETSAWSYA